MRARWKTGSPATRRGVRATVVTALCAAVVAAASGCASGDEFRGIYNLPLPGGADLGDHPYQVTAEFEDVLQLVPNSAVRVNHVAVGRVTTIDLPEDSWTARVTMLVNGDVRLPANAIAEVQKSSLLGENYVALAPPADGPATGTLADGATIPLSRTNRGTQVEEVLGALSLLLNGGGIEQVNTITTELNAALAGNEPEIRALLGEIDVLMSSLDDNRRDISRALDELNELSDTLADRDEQIRTVLDNLTPGLRELENQRGALVTMLRELDRLSDVAVDTMNRSTENMVADLEALLPILRRLAEAGRALPEALEVLFTYPFTDEVLNAIRGDYLNVFLSVTASTDDCVIIPPSDTCTVIPPLNPDQGSGDGEGTGAGAPGVQGVPQPLPLPLPAVSGTTTSTPAPSDGAPGSLSPGSGGSGSDGSGGSGSGSPASPGSSGTSPGTPPGSSSGSSGTSQTPPEGSSPSGTQQPGGES